MILQRFQNTFFEGLKSDVTEELISIVTCQTSIQLQNRSSKWRALDSLQPLNSDCCIFFFGLRKGLDEFVAKIKCCCNFFAQFNLTKHHIIFIAFPFQWSPLFVSGTLSKVTIAYSIGAKQFSTANTKSEDLPQWLLPRR